jgi:phosphohistidine phosphatase SixA
MKVVFWIVALMGLVVPSVRGEGAPAIDDVMRALRAGGHVIVVRHGATHPDQADTDPLHLENVAKQRQLNDKGRAQAKAVGDVFKTAGIRIGKLYSSRFYRAVETARLMGGKEPEATDDATEGGLVVTPNENTRRAQALRALAGTVPAAGTNTLIVTHKPNIIDAFGKDWFEVKEGEATIFQPGANGEYSLIGRVQIEQWETAKK